MKSYQPAGAINRKLCWFYSVFFLICSKMTAVTVKLYWIDVKEGNVYVACQSSAPSLVWREAVEWCISSQYCGCPSPASLLVPVFQRKMGLLEQEWTFRLLELGATSFFPPKTEKNHNRRSKSFPFLSICLQSQLFEKLSVDRNDLSHKLL